MWAVSLRPLGDVKAVGGGIRLMARGGEEGSCWLIARRSGFSREPDYQRRG